MEKTESALDYAEQLFCKFAPLESRYLGNNKVQVGNFDYSRVPDIRGFSFKKGNIVTTVGVLPFMGHKNAHVTLVKYSDQSVSKGFKGARFGFGKIENYFLYPEAGLRGLEGIYEWENKENNLVFSCLTIKGKYNEGGKIKEPFIIYSKHNKDWGRSQVGDFERTLPIGVPIPSYLVEKTNNKIKYVHNEIFGIPIPWISESNNFKNSEWDILKKSGLQEFVEEVNKKFISQ